MSPRGRVTAVCLFFRDQGKKRKGSGRGGGQGTRGGTQLHPHVVSCDIVYFFIFPHMIRYYCPLSDVVLVCFPSRGIFLGIIKYFLRFFLTLSHCCDGPHFVKKKLRSVAPLASVALVFGISLCVCVVLDGAAFFLRSVGG